MRALLVLSLVWVCVAQAKPKYSIGMSTSIFEKQVDIETILAAFALPSYHGLVGEGLDEACRRKTVTELLPYAAGRRRITKLVAQDRDDTFPGLKGSVEKPSHHLWVTFTDEKENATEKEFACPRAQNDSRGTDRVFFNLKLWQFVLDPALVLTPDDWDSPHLQERQQDGENTAIDEAYSSMTFAERTEVETFLARLAQPAYYTQNDTLLDEQCRKKLLVELLPYAAGRRKIVKAETQELIGPVPGHIYGTRKGEIHLIALTLEDENKVQTQVSLSCQRGRAVHPGLSTKSTNEALSYLKLWGLKKDGPMDTKARLIERPHAP